MSYILNFLIDEVPAGHPLKDELLSVMQSRSSAEMVESILTAALALTRAGFDLDVREIADDVGRAYNFDPAKGGE